MCICCCWFKRLASKLHVYLASCQREIRLPTALAHPRNPCLFQYTDCATLRRFGAISRETSRHFELELSLCIVQRRISACSLSSERRICMTNMLEVQTGGRRHHVQLKPHPASPPCALPSERHSADTSRSASLERTEHWTAALFLWIASSVPRSIAVSCLRSQSRASLRGRAMRSVRGAQRHAEQYDMHAD